MAVRNACSAETEASGDRINNKPLLGEHGPATLLKAPRPRPNVRSLTPSNSAASA
jgi:hypothetical protein